MDEGRKLQPENASDQLGNRAEHNTEYKVYQPRQLDMDSADHGFFELPTELLILFTTLLLLLAQAGLQTLLDLADIGMYLPSKVCELLLKMGDPVFERCIIPRRYRSPAIYDIVESILYATLTDDRSRASKDRRKFSHPRCESLP